MLFSDSLVFESAVPESGCDSKYWEFEYGGVLSEGWWGWPIRTVCEVLQVIGACGAAGHGVRVELAQAFLEW
jgi:hypothetical protein